MGLLEENGCRSGYGDGCGCGYGDEDGYGNGDVDGSGDGSGDGEYGVVVDTVDKYNVIRLNPWSEIKVGCHVYLPEYWEKHWQAIARQEGLDVDPKRVEEILTAIERNANKRSTDNEKPL